MPPATPAPVLATTPKAVALRSHGPYPAKARRTRLGEAGHDLLHAHARER
jgi:hypothetical protein